MFAKRFNINKLLPTLKINYDIAANCHIADFLVGVSALGIKSFANLIFGHMLSNFVHCEFTAAAVVALKIKLHKVVLSAEL